MRCVCVCVFVCLRRLSYSILIHKGSGEGGISKTPKGRSVMYPAHPSDTTPDPAASTLGFSTGWEGFSGGSSSSFCSFLLFLGRSCELLFTRMEVITTTIRRQYITAVKGGRRTHKLDMQSLSIPA